MVPEGCDINRAHPHLLRDAAPRLWGKVDGGGSQPGLNTRRAHAAAPRPEPARVQLKDEPPAIARVKGSNVGARYELLVAPDRARTATVLAPSGG